MNGTGSRGFPWLEVTVESIDNGLADVVDQFGEHKTIRVDILRAKGVAPQVGERWVIDRSLGYWTFAGVVGYGGYEAEEVRTPEIIITNYNAPERIKKVADYVLTGHGGAVINEAIESLGTDGGTIRILTPGDSVWVEESIIPRPGVRLEGDRRTTLLGYNVPVFDDRSVNSTWDEPSGGFVQGTEIVGFSVADFLLGRTGSPPPGDPKEYGVAVLSTCADFSFERCQFGPNYYAVYAYGLTQRMRLDRCFLDRSPMFITTILSGLTGHEIVGSRFLNVGGGDGAVHFYMVNGSLIADNLFQGCDIPVFLNGATGSQVARNRMFNTGCGAVYVLGTQDAEVSENFIAVGGWRAHNTYDGILLANNARNNNIHDNTVRGTTYHDDALGGDQSKRWRYGIAVDDSSCFANRVTDNDLLNSGATGSLRNVGTGTVTAGGNRL